MVQFTKPFKPDEITIEYRRLEGGANFVVPEPTIQMSVKEVDKAAAYGIYLTGPDRLIMDPDEVEGSEGMFKFDLGIDFKLPDRYSMLHHGLIEDSVDYIVDNSSINEWYKVYLYSNTNEVLFRPKEAILKIIPILDKNYSFIYKNRT